MAQYQAFVEHSRYKTRNADSLGGLSNHPVVWVSWHDALAYCRWLDAKLKAISREMAGQKQIGNRERILAVD